MTRDNVGNIWDPDPLYVPELETWAFSLDDSTYRVFRASDEDRIRAALRPRRNHRWLIAALAVLALIAWRTRSRD